MKKRLWQIPSALAVATLLGLGTARAADPVITDTLLTTVGVIRGGDVGDGLDLDGKFVYALSIGADVGFEAKIRDATFMGLIDSEVPGATVEAGNRILNWYAIDYGDSANDDLLEAATSSIRWSAGNSATLPQVILTLENLEPGVQYKVQMMFGEQCCNRGFDVFFDDQMIIKDFNPGVVHAEGKGSLEALITHLYTPKQKTAVLRFDGREASTDYSDHNAILNAVTFEKIGVALDTDKDGMPDSFETQYGFNPNDASDAAKDFDKDGATNLEEFKAGTDPVDVIKPTVLSAVASATFGSVVLTFSEVVDPTTGADVKNYAMTPSLAVTAAAVKKNIVTLTTAKQTPGAVAYTVAVTGVTDTSKNAVAAGAKAIFYSYVNVKNGILKFSYWSGIGGNPVDNLLSDPRYPATPTEVSPVFSFNSRDVFPTDSHEAYGATMEGFLTPTETASYNFFLRSDDASQLFLSTDDKEANLALIAEETGCCKAFLEPGVEVTTAAPIALTAGKKYFIRVIYKEGGGGDYAQVAWRKTTDTKPAGSLTPIPGQFLSAAVDLAAAPEGAFTVMTPAANAKNVNPASHVTIAHRDGKTEWTVANVSLKVDGATVTPTITKVGTVLTIDHKFPSLAASASVHTVSLSYLDAGGQPATRDWSYTTQVYGGPARDKVGAYTAILTGKTAYTADKGGATGKAGDYGMDLTKAGGPVISYDETFLNAANAATAKDELSVAFWQKKYDIADSSAFTLQSPTTPNQRTFHAHVPWSNGHVYFDTTGCCDGATQRIETDIANFSGYSGELSWWTNQWHLFVFTKKADVKQIWIDGLLFFEGNNTGVMATDNNGFVMGGGGGGGEASHAIVDDFSVYSKQLLQADVLALSKGTLPTALPAAKGLIAYWDFNEGAAKPAPKFTSIKVTGINVTLTWEGGGTLQVANEVTGPWVDIPAAAGGVSPLTTKADQARRFARIKQ